MMSGLKTFQMKTGSFRPPCPVLKKSLIQKLRLASILEVHLLSSDTSGQGAVCQDPKGVWLVTSRQADLIIRIDGMPAHSASTRQFAHIHQIARRRMIVGNDLYAE